MPLKNDYTKPEEIERQKENRRTFAEMHQRCLKDCPEQFERLQELIMDTVSLGSKDDILGAIGLAQIPSAVLYAILAIGSSMMCEEMTKFQLEQRKQKDLAERN